MARLVKAEHRAVGHSDDRHRLPAREEGGSPPRDENPSDPKGSRSARSGIRQRSGRRPRNRHDALEPEVIDLSRPSDTAHHPRNVGEALHEGRHRKASGKGAPLNGGSNAGWRRLLLQRSRRPIA